MNNIRELRNYGIGIFSWLVKGVGIALFMLVLVVHIGEKPPNPFELSARELFLMTGFLTILVGLILALWRQLIGGIAVLAGTIPFLGELHHWLLYVFISVGILNIVCWWLKRLQEKCTVATNNSATREGLR